MWTFVLWKVILKIQIIQSYNTSSIWHSLTNHKSANVNSTQTCVVSALLFLNTAQQWSDDNGFSRITTAITISVVDRSSLSLNCAQLVLEFVHPGVNHHVTIIRMCEPGIIKCKIHVNFPYVLFIFVSCYYLVNTRSDPALKEYLFSKTT